MLGKHLVNFNTADKVMTRRMFRLCSFPRPPADPVKMSPPSRELICAPNSPISAGRVSLRGKVEIRCHCDTLILCSLWERHLLCLVYCWLSRLVSWGMERQGRMHQDGPRHSQFLSYSSQTLNLEMWHFFSFKVAILHASSQLESDEVWTNPFICVGIIWVWKSFSTLKITPSLFSFKKKRGKCSICPL